MDQTPKYKRDDKLFCSDPNNLCNLYMVKLLTDGTLKSGQIMYRVHYVGWSSRKDADVAEDLLHGDTEENRMKAEMVKHKQKKGNKKSIPSKFKPYGRKSLSRKESICSTSSASSFASSIKKNYNSERFTEKPGLSVTAPTDKPPMNIDIPIELKRVLIEDMNYVQKYNMIVKVPATTTIDQLMDQFVLEQNLTFDPDELNGFVVRKAVAVELTCGLKLYFSHMLRQLLYNQERPQYREVVESIENKFKSTHNYIDMKKNVLVELTAFYSPIHLLRMFTKIDVMGEHLQTMSTTCWNWICCCIEQLLEYMKQHREQLFVGSVMYVNLNLNDPPNFIQDVNQQVKDLKL